MCGRETTNIFLFISIGLVIICCYAQSVCACGFYLEMNIGDSIELKSDNYPGFAGIMAKCAWTLLAPQNYSLSVTIVDFVGNSNPATGYCGDKLMIKNSNSSANSIFEDCSIPTKNYMVNVSDRAVNVQFISDHLFNDSRFYGIVTPYSFPNSSYKYIICGFPQFSCPNKECIEYSYICDGYNDCGCSDSMCDEGAGLCTKTNLDTNVTVVLPVLAGFFIFSIIFTFSALSDAKACDCFRIKCRHQCSCCICVDKKNKDEDSGEGHHLKQAMQRLLRSDNGGAVASGTGTPHTHSRRSSQYLSPRPSIAQINDDDRPDVDIKYGNSLMPSNVPGMRQKDK